MTLFPGITRGTCVVSAIVVSAILRIHYDLRSEQMFYAVKV